MNDVAYYLGAFLAALLICSCAALAVASWFNGVIKPRTPRMVVLSGTRYSSRQTGRRSHK